MRLGSLAWRGLRSRPVRTALTVAGVALGVAVVTATLVAGQASEQAVRSAVTELLGRADLRVRAFETAGFTPRAVQSLRSLPGVDAGAPVAERRVTIAVEPALVETLLVVGIEPEADAAVRDPPLAIGVPLGVNGPGDAHVGAAWAAENGLTLGDRIILTGAGPGTPPLDVVGLLDDSGFGALDEGAVLVMSRAMLDAAFDVPAPVRYVDLDVADGETATVRAAIRGALGEPFIIESAAEAGSGLGRAQAGFAAVAFVLGLVALVVGTFLVGNTLAMTVNERMREIGLLRAAGASSRQVRNLILRQGAAIGIAGAAAGTVLGVLLAAGMIAFLRSTRAVLIGGLPVSPWIVLVAGGLGVLATVLGALLPAMRAAALSPLDALHPARRTDRGVADRLRWLLGLEVVVVVAALLLYPTGPGAPSLLPVALSLILLMTGAIAAAYVLEPLGNAVGRPFEWFFGVQGLLGRVNLARDRARTGLTVGALMMALAAVVALGSVAESARAGSERWIGSVLPGGHAIRVAAPLDVETYRPTLQATAGLQVATPIVEAPAVARDAAAQREVSLAGVDPNVFQDAGALSISGAARTDAFAALRAGGAVLVPAAFATREGVGVGDVVPLAVPGAEAQPFRVAGILDFSLPGRTPDGSFIVSLADARDIFGATSAALWAMIPQPDVAPSAFRAAVRDTAISLAGEPLTASELASDMSRGLGRLVGLFDALSLVAVVIAGLGIVNTLSVGVSERVREIAILRASGMTVGQIQAMVVTEAAIMGTIGGLLAIATGLAVAWGLVNAAAPQEFAAGLVLPWSLLVAVVLVGTGVAALAALYPARVAGTLPLVRHLKQFE